MSVLAKYSQKLGHGKFLGRDETIERMLEGKGIVDPQDLIFRAELCVFLYHERQAVEYKKRKRVRKALRDRYRTLKGYGICVKCGKADVEPGFSTCRACRLDRNQAKYGYVDRGKKYFTRKKKAALRASAGV